MTNRRNGIKNHVNGLLPSQLWQHTLTEDSVSHFTFSSKQYINARVPLMVVLKGNERGITQLNAAMGTTITSSAFLNSGCSFSGLQHPLTFPVLDYNFMLPLWFSYPEC